MRLSGLLLACAVLGGACPESIQQSSGDVVIPTQSQCDYAAQCVGKITLQTCQVADCVLGTCMAVVRIGMECAAPGAGECETGSCREDGACQVALAPNGTACQTAEWDACTGYRCESGVCSSYSVRGCDDDNDCTDDSCNPAAAEPCVHTAHAKSCDDDNPCTTGDTCVAGVCTGANQCQCDQDEDCAAFDDNDKCNGVLVCNEDARTCDLLPGSRVSCEGMEAGQCQQVTCNKAKGKCETTSLAEFSACDDGEACTGCAPSDPGCATHDYCQSGVCKAGPGKACACAEDAACAGFDDGDLCNGVWRCLAGTCAVDPSTLVVCAADSAPVCSELVCDPAKGVCNPEQQPAGTACDAGPCTEGDKCDAQGACVAGAGSAACDCASDAECAGFDDGNLCNGTWVCQAGKCAKNDTPVTCPAVTCHVATCVPETGACQHVLATPGAACEDADPCTLSGTCDAAGACMPGVSTLCGCAGDAECAKFDDADKCNGTWSCQAGTCAPDPGTAVDCSGLVVEGCQIGACEPATGNCKPMAGGDGKLCDDGDPCTTSDACLAGTCAGKDEGACVCAADLECAIFDDGDQCNGLWACDGGKCAPWFLDCAPGQCDPKLGCVQ